uniref:Triple QxxK/R motif-containing protein n=1 Tax=Takifugu rubripes TaxID=31033 RepID=A0A674ML95_TAKRU
MGRKDASASALPVDQYRKQIGKQDYKKTKPALRAARLKAEAKKNSSGFRGLSRRRGCTNGFSSLECPIERQQKKTQFPFVQNNYGKRNLFFFFYSQLCWLLFKLFSSAVTRIRRTISNFLPTFAIKEPVKLVNPHKSDEIGSSMTFRNC